MITKRASKVGKKIHQEINKIIKKAFKLNEKMNEANETIRSKAMFIYILGSIIIVGITREKTTLLHSSHTKTHLEFTSRFIHR